MSRTWSTAGDLTAYYDVLNAYYKRYPQAPPSGYRLIGVMLRIDGLGESDPPAVVVEGQGRDGAVTTHTSLPVGLSLPRCPGLPSDPARIHAGTSGCLIFELPSAIRVLRVGSPQTNDGVQPGRPPPSSATSAPDTHLEVGAG